MTPSESLTETEVLFFLGIILITGFSVYMIIQSLRRLRLIRAAKKASTSPIGSVTGGWVEFRGKACAMVPPPGTPAWWRPVATCYIEVWAQISLTETFSSWMRHGRVDPKDQWRLVYSGWLIQSFVIRDATGACTIDLMDHEKIGNLTVHHSKDLDPHRKKRFFEDFLPRLKADSLWGSVFQGSGTIWKIHEFAVPVGAEAYALGTFEPHPQEKPISIQESSEGEPVTLIPNGGLRKGRRHSRLIGVGDEEAAIGQLGSPYSALFLSAMGLLFGLLFIQFWITTQE